MAGRAGRVGAVLCWAWAAVVFALAPGVANAGAVGGGALPRRNLLDGALSAYRRVEAAGLLHTRLLTVIDYSLPSSQRRLWVLDPDRLRVLFHEFVAHGRGSGPEDAPERALWFGNDSESHRSSLGTYLTGDTYTGEHGHSLVMIGLEPGVNDRALERRIVMHPADYVSASYRARSGGRVGRSWGCPALDPLVAPVLIDRIQDRSVIYVGGAPMHEETNAPVATLARAGVTPARVAAVPGARTATTRRAEP